jgi:hypothetical protein
VLGIGRKTLYRKLESFGVLLGDEGDDDVPSTGGKR